MSIVFNSNNHSQFPAVFFLTCLLRLRWRFPKKPTVRWCGGAPVATKTQKVGDDWPIGEFHDLWHIESANIC